MESYEIIFAISGFCFIMFIFTSLLQAEKIKEKKERMETENIIYETELKHITGHPYLSQGDIILLQICNNNIVRFYKKNTNAGGEIPINQITRYELKTESEIQKDVTLTRLLALGIFAFGAKKKTEINNTYFILSYVQNNVPIDCIFKNTVNNQQLGNIISTLNRLKIEQNNIEYNYQTV